MSPTPFSDPLADEKLNRIKQLRASRSSTEMKREAIERARLLIAEAEKAAKSLEVATVTDATAQASLFETRKLLSEAIRAMQSVESASNVDGDVLQKNPGSNGDAGTLRSNYYMDNSLIIPPLNPGPFDARSTHYLSFRNNGKANYYDTYKSGAGNSLNNMFTGDISHHAHKYSHSTEIICRAEVLSYVNSLFRTPNITTEDTAKKFEVMTDKTVENNSMCLSDQNLLHPSMNYGSMVDEFGDLDKTQESEEGPMPIFSKDITVSVDANFVASKGLTEDIAGISESRSLQHLSVNHSSMVDESVVLANTEELEEDPVPNLLKDIRVSVDANYVASKGQTKNIAGIFESRSAHAGSNGILASNKDVKKMWIRGRLIEVKGE